MYRQKFILIFPSVLLFITLLAPLTLAKSDHHGHLNRKGEFHIDLDGPSESSNLEGSGSGSESSIKSDDEDLEDFNKPSIVNQPSRSESDILLSKKKEPNDLEGSGLKSTSPPSVPPSSSSSPSPSSSPSHPHPHSHHTRPHPFDDENDEESDDDQDYNEDSEDDTEDEDEDENVEGSGDPISSKTDVHRNNFGTSTRKTPALDVDTGEDEDDVGDEDEEEDEDDDDGNDEDDRLDSVNRPMIPNLEDDNHSPFKPLSVPVDSNSLYNESLNTIHHTPSKEDNNIINNNRKLDLEYDGNTLRSDVSILGQKQASRSSKFLNVPGILAAVIGGAVVGLLCAILLAMFVIYRMRKKEEDEYVPETNKLTTSRNPYGKGGSRFFDP